MTAIPDLNTLINIMTGGTGGTQQQWFSIDGRVDAAAAAATVNGRFTSLWQYNKNPGGFGATPGAASNPVNTTNGSLMQSNPAGGQQLWLVGWGMQSSQIGSFMLYDRLAQFGGADGTVTTAQTVNASVSRYTGAASAGNQIWIEIYTQIGASSTTITASYTNQAGTAGQTTKAAAIGNTGLREAQRLIPLALQDGDTGVQSVQTVTLNATTGTAGNFGVTLMRPLATSAVGAPGTGFITDFVTSLPSMPEVKTNASLALVYLSGATTAPVMQGQISLAAF